MGKAASLAVTGITEKAAILLPANRCMAVRSSDKSLMPIVVNLDMLQSFSVLGPYTNKTRCMYASQVMCNSNVRSEEADHSTD